MEDARGSTLQTILGALRYVMKHRPHLVFIENVDEAILILDSLRTIFDKDGYHLLHTNAVEPWDLRLPVARLVVLSSRPSGILLRRILTRRCCKRHSMTSSGQARNSSAVCQCPSYLIIAFHMLMPIYRKCSKCNPHQGRRPQMRIGLVSMSRLSVQCV